MTINNKELLSAFVDLKLQPIVGDWALKLERVNCACGLSALAAKKIGFDEYYNRLATAQVMEPTGAFEILEEILGLDKPFMEGFVAGFDGFAMYLTNDRNRNYPLSEAGYLAGVEARDYLSDKIIILDADEYLQAVDA